MSCNQTLTKPWTFCQRPSVFPDGKCRSQIFEKGIDELAGFTLVQAELVE